MSPQDILPNIAKCQQENALLDGLEASFAGLSKPKKKTSKKKAAAQPKVFDVKLTEVDDKKVISWVRNLYQKTRKAMHVSNNLSIKTVYTVEIATMKAAFDAHGAKMKDIRKLWHGTQASNVLSILRQGLIIPKSSSAHCTGRMYGDGIYASSISTKALNYATSFWGGSGSNRTFMFLLDMAMGNYHLAGSGWGSYPVRGTDSTWAKGGRSGVINDEMIVYRLDQCNLTHLVEFEERSRR
jgi:poly [ADP-ribose] polymerase